MSRNDHGLAMELEEILLRWQQKYYADSRLILVEPGPHTDEYEVSNAGAEVVKLVRELQAKAYTEGLSAGITGEHLLNDGQVANPYGQ